MLVTGHSLHHPFQSNENGYRQFLACNAALSYRTIRKELIVQLDKGSSDPVYWRKPTIDLYREWVKPLSVSLLRRTHHNCRLCAESFYHSYLYELPWLKKCPLHPAEPLSDHCPRCGSPWFTNIKACFCCGTNVGFLKILKRRQSFDIDWENLKLIESVVNSFNQLHHLTRATFTDPIFPVTQNDSIFPSIAAHLFPETQKLFKRLGVNIYRCTEHTFEIKQTLDGKPDRIPLYRKDTVSIDEVAGKIKNFINNRTSHKSTENITDEKYEIVSLDILFNAFRVWKNLITSKSRFGMSCNYYTYLYQVFFGVSSPRRPEISDQFTFENPEGGYQYFEISKQVQEMLYKFDLWIKYFSILEAIIYFEKEPTNPLSDLGPIGALAHPNISSSPLVSVIERDKRIHLIFPTWIYDSNPKKLIDFFRKTE